MTDPATASPQAVLDKWIPLAAKVPAARPTTPVTILVGDPVLRGLERRE